MLTGETGAGKSLIVDALSLLIGNRATGDYIRSDSEEAVLEAAFLIPDGSVLGSHLRESDYLSAGGNDLVIRRVLSRSGKNRTYLNGNLAPLQTVQELTGGLIDIHGQHDQQSLLSSASQLEVLDEFGKARELKIRYQNARIDWLDKKREVDEAVTKEAELKNREEFLQFQLHELRKANLQPGEEEALNQEYQRLKYSRRLGELTDEAFQTLYGSEQSVLEQMQSVSHCLSELAEIDSSLAPWPTLTESTFVSLRELADGLRDYRQGLDYDPERLAEIDERLANLQRLKKKYEATVEDLIHQTQVLQNELDALSHSQAWIEELSRAVSQTRVLVIKLANELSQIRRHAAKELEQKIKREFAALRMDHIEFRVQVDSHSDNGDFGATGVDRVAFLLATNLGEPVQPLARIASGGELSRIMLAIKSVLAGADQIPVLIFDEVDTGIGGGVATVMGQRLRTLGQYHQVFCVTHLPQIASQATTHFLIEKQTRQNRTVMKAKALTGSDRQEEIARMLGGVEITPSVQQTAAEMLGDTIQKKGKRSR